MILKKKFNDYVEQKLNKGDNIQNIFEISDSPFQILFRWAESATIEKTETYLIKLFKKNLEAFKILLVHTFPTQTLSTHIKSFCLIISIDKIKKFINENEIDINKFINNISDQKIRKFINKRIEYLKNFEE